MRHLDAWARHYYSHYDYSDDWSLLLPTLSACSVCMQWSAHLRDTFKDCANDFSSQNNLKLSSDIHRRGWRENLERYTRTMWPTCYYSHSNSNFCNWSTHRHFLHMLIFMHMLKTIVQRAPHHPQIAPHHDMILRIMDNIMDNMWAQWYYCTCT